MTKETELPVCVYNPDIGIAWKLIQDEVKVFQREGSPWVEIEVPDGAIAIWAVTGAVHPVTESGAVTDDPVDLPFPDDGGRQMVSLRVSNATARELTASAPPRNSPIYNELSAAQCELLEALRKATL